MDRRRHHRIRIEGTISSAGFGQHRLVVGRWTSSPLGPFGDVMWATPDDERILLAPTDEVAAFITSIYVFDDVRVGALAVHGDDRFTSVEGHEISARLAGGRRWALPSPRPLWVTRWLEAPVARALMGVRTHGASPTGAHEWYQASGWRWIVGGHATLDRAAMGAPGRLTRPVGVGFSEPPRRPSIVAVRVTIDC